MEEIEEFVKIVDRAPDCGCGDGYGDALGYGDSFIHSFGYGSGLGSGSGYGLGHGLGSDDGCGDSSGYSFIHGYGFGDGFDYGFGDGSDDKIATYNGNKVYHIDEVATIIETVRGNVAKGYILNADLTTTPCFVAKENNLFAHGDTLHEAIMSLQEKLNESLPTEERIKRFRKKFPDIRKKYPAADLFVWHHVLTGSCMTGRKSFCKDHGIDIEKDTFSVEEFVKLTKDSYGGEIIQKILNT